MKTISLVLFLIPLVFIVSLFVTELSLCICLYDHKGGICNIDVYLCNNSDNVFNLDAHSSMWLYGHSVRKEITLQWVPSVVFKLRITYNHIMIFAQAINLFPRPFLSARPQQQDTLIFFIVYLWNEVFESHC